MDKLIKIGAAAKELEVSTRTIRYYEEIGLINSERNTESNYRMYNKKNLNKLKQIIFFRKIQFSIEDIKILLNGSNNSLKEEILVKKYEEVKKNSLKLLNLKDILETTISIGREKGIEGINFYNVLSKLVYINSKNEEGIKMKEKEILVEFGVGIIPYVDRNQGGTITNDIKKLRKELLAKYEIRVPLIHLRDNEALNEYGYEITINGRTVFAGNVNNYDDNNKKNEFLKDIKNTLIKNNSLIEKINNNENIEN